MKLFKIVQYLEVDDLDKLRAWIKERDPNYDQYAPLDDLMAASLALLNMDPPDGCQWGLQIITDKDPS